MRRFLTVLLLGLLILTIGSIGIYHSYENKVGSVGPVFLQPIERQGNVTDMMMVTMYTPTSSLVEASCNGNGVVEVYDIITGKLVSRENIYGHLTYQFVLPREGDYLVLNNGTGKLTCAFRFIKNYPTKDVQDAIYGLGTVFALLLALVIWRWRK